MNTLARTALVSLALGAGSLAPLAAPAEAAAPAAVTVTIKAEGVELSGEVKSSKLVCKDGRTVTVYKQKGARGGGDDVRLASDTSGLQGGKYVWSTGNTGVEGRFYAVVKKTAQCKRAVSATIRAVRPD